MDGRRFDALVREMARTTTGRREVLKKLAGALVGGGVAIAALSEQADAKQRCRTGGAVCRKDADCCGTTCNAADATGRRRCACGNEETACGSVCCQPGEVCTNGRCKQPTPPTTTTTTTTPSTTTTPAPTTQAPTTQAPTTQAPTTESPSTTQAPTTTPVPTTPAPTTKPPAPTTTTPTPTTPAPTTKPPAPTTTTHAPGGGGGCFVAGTLVAMADGTSRPIELITPGDRLLCRDGLVNEVRAVDRPVLGQRPLYALNGGPAFVTAEHPFLTEHGWKAIDPAATAVGHPGLRVERLAVGDRLLALAAILVPAGVGGSGFAAPIEVRQESRILAQMDAHHADPDTQLYNLLLDGDHTYFANDYLVHNKVIAFVRSAHDDEST